MDLFSILFTLTLLDSISRTQAGLIDTVGTLFNPEQIKKPVGTLFSSKQLEKPVGTFLNPVKFQKPLEAFNPLFQNNDTKKVLDTRSDENLDRRNDNHPHDWQNSQNPRDFENSKNAKHKGEEMRSDENVDQRNNHASDRRNSQIPNIQDDYDPSLRRIDEDVDRKIATKNINTEGLVPRYNEDEDQRNDRERGFRGSQNKENRSTQNSKDFDASSKRTNEYENTNDAAKHQTKSGVGDKDRDRKEEPIASTEKAVEDKGLKPLSRKKFYYQAQPVVPENERKDIKETIYYVD